MYSSLNRKISRAYKAKMLNAIEAIAVMVFSLFAIVLLPQLLIQYVYANQQLLEAPALLEYIPVAFFALGAGFFAYAVVANIMLWMKVRKWEAELEAVGDDCCGGDCCGGACCSDMGMGMSNHTADLKSVMATASTATKKAATKKSSRKTTKK